MAVRAAIESKQLAVASSMCNGKDRPATVLGLQLPSLRPWGPVTTT